MSGRHDILTTGRVTNLFEGSNESGMLMPDGTNRRTSGGGHHAEENRIVDPGRGGRTDRRHRGDDGGVAKTQRSGLQRDPRTLCPVRTHVRQNRSGSVRQCVHGRWSVHHRRPRVEGAEGNRLAHDGFWTDEESSENLPRQLERAPRAISGRRERLRVCRADGPFEESGDHRRRRRRRPPGSERVDRVAYRDRPVMGKRAIRSVPTAPTQTSLPI